MTIDADVLFAEGESGQPADAAAETWIAADLEGVFESEDFKAGASDEKLGAAMTAKDPQPAPLSLSPEKDDTALGTVLMEGDSVGGGAEEPVLAIDPESGIATITAPTPGISRTHMIVVRVSAAAQGLHARAGRLDDRPGLLPGNVVRRVGLTVMPDYVRAVEANRCTAVAP